MLILIASFVWQNFLLFPSWLACSLNSTSSGSASEPFMWVVNIRGGLPPVYMQWGVCWRCRHVSTCGYTVFTITVHRTPLNPCTWIHQIVNTSTRMHPHYLTHWFQFVLKRMSALYVLVQCWALTPKHMDSLLSLECMQRSDPGWPTPSHEWSRVANPFTLTSIQGDPTFTAPPPSHILPSNSSRILLHNNT